MEKLFTFEELAESWQVPIEVVRGHFQAGRLNGIDLGLETPIWRFHTDDLQRFFARLRERTDTQPPAPPAVQPRFSLPAVARLNIKPGARAGRDPRAFCFKEGVAGMGWPVNTEPGIPLTWEVYQQRATASYGGGSWQPVVGLHDLPDRAVIWTRSGYGRNTRFWVGLVTGPWQYRDDPEARAADIENVRPVLWHEVGGYEAVPSAIARSFTPVTFAYIKQDEALIFTETLAARLVADGVWPD